MTGLEGLNRSQLGALYNDYVVYRDKECGGWAKIGIVNFYIKHRKKYELDDCKQQN